MRPASGRSKERSLPAGRALRSVEQAGVQSQWSTRQWHSPGASSARASELGPARVEPEEFEHALASVPAAEHSAGAFVIVPVAAVDHESLQRLVEAANACRVDWRICLAVDGATLARIDMSAIEGDHVGVLLDGVGLDTPLADMVRDGVEAVRFDPEFIVGAARSLRVACALEAMLILARDLGLCTLGTPGALFTESALLSCPAFDFVPSSAFRSVADESDQDVGFRANLRLRERLTPFS